MDPKPNRDRWSRTVRRHGKLFSLTVSLGLLFSLYFMALGSPMGSTALAADRPGGRVVIGSPQEPGTLLAHFDLLTLTHEVQHLIYDCLFTLDASGAYIPRLAAEVPTLENGGISPDGRTYTIPLRQGVKWHDGQPFTADDVVFTWQVVNDPDLPIPSRVIWEDIESIEVVDPYTIKVNFPQTNVGFLAAASTDSCYILPRHLLEGTDIANSPLHRQPVGTGPFKVEEWAAGSHIRLTASPHYWEEGKPYLDEVVFRVIPSTEGQRAALQRGDIDLALHLTAAELPFVESLPGYQVVSQPTYAKWLFWLNNADPIVGDLAVRRALAHGLDKAAITETVMRGVTEPLHAVFPASHWAHNPDVRVYEYDPERAVAILEEAGWRRGSDGIFARDGQRLRIEIVNIAGEAERLRVVQVAQALWRSIGIDAQIREIDAASFPPTMASGNYQVAYGWFGERHEPVFGLWLGGNWQRYNNQEALDLLRRAPTVVDAQERGGLIRRFQAYAAEDVAILPLASRTILNAVSTRLQGYQPGLAGSLWNAADWQVR